MSILPMKSQRASSDGEYESIPDGTTRLLNPSNGNTGYYQMSSSNPNMLNPGGFSKGFDELTDEEKEIRSYSLDDFSDVQHHIRQKTLKTGRQRQKIAARRKGGDFQSKRRKKRIYFCCISSDIDVQAIYDFMISSSSFPDWRCNQYNDCLHLCRTEKDKLKSHLIPLNQHYDNTGGNSTQNSFENPFELAATPKLHMIHQNSDIFKMSDGTEQNNLVTQPSQETIYMDDASIVEEGFDISSPGAQEVFVFDFGAVVFWNFSRGEEGKLLGLFREFATKGKVGISEFESGEDDMAFVITSEVQKIKIANDVFSIPERTPIIQRLSASFAIAQSSVLAIFEARIEQKVEEYKYIPEALAKQGKLQLTERKLGTMIGEVFVIRHDVNLNTEILDTPDFFWLEDRFESDYEMIMKYLEMGNRIEILNKRLDLLRELLDVLQQQMDSAHGVKLEWIVIYLIVAEVFLELFSMFFLG